MKVSCSYKIPISDRSAYLQIPESSDIKIARSISLSFFYRIPSITSRFFEVQSFASSKKSVKKDKMRFTDRFVQGYLDFFRGEIDATFKIDADCASVVLLLELPDIEDEQVSMLEDALFTDGVA